MGKKKGDHKKDGLPPLPPERRKDNLGKNDIARAELPSVGSSKARPSLPVDAVIVDISKMTSSTSPKAEIDKLSFERLNSMIKRGMNDLNARALASTSVMNPSQQQVKVESKNVDLDIPNTRKAAALSSSQTAASKEGGASSFEKPENTVYLNRQVVAKEGTSSTLENSNEPVGIGRTSEPPYLEEASTSDGQSSYGMEKALKQRLKEMQASRSKASTPKPLDALVKNVRHSSKTLSKAIEVDDVPQQIEIYVRPKTLAKTRDQHEP